MQMRLLDLLVSLGVRPSWTRGRRTYRLLQSIFATERAPTRR